MHTKEQEAANNALFDQVTDKHIQHNAQQHSLAMLLEWSSRSNVADTTLLCYISLLSMTLHSTE